MAIENLDEMLQKAFDESTAIYRQRGFQRRIGLFAAPDGEDRHAQSPKAQDRVFVADNSNLMHTHHTASRG